MKKNKTNTKRKIKIKIKTKKNRDKSKSNKKKGGTNSKSSCVICDKKNNDNSNMLIPNECLMKHGKYKAHKICSNCWWNNFAKEGSNHKCPGCVNKKPLNIEKNNNTNNNSIIDLTND